MSSGEVKPFRHLGNKKDRLDLLCYLTELRSWLRADNWNIIIMADPEDEVMAYTDTVRNHCTQSIWLNKNWKSYTAERRRHVLLHELVHSQHRDQDYLWNDCVRDNSDLSKAGARDWTEDWVMHQERFVSWITMRLMPFAPAWPGTARIVGDGICYEGDEA